MPLNAIQGACGETLALVDPSKRLHHKAKRLECKINGSGCWEVVSHVPCPSGYVIISVNGAAERAHRYTYREFVGEIPEGMIVRHSCDNRRCINPAHLSVGTHEDNMADCVERGRIARGEGIGVSKLKEADVLEIFASRKSVTEIVRVFDITDTTVRQIRAGKTWSWLTKQHEGMQR